MTKWCEKDLKANFSVMLPVNIYLFEVNNRNTRKSCEICSKLTRKTPEGCQQHHH